MSSPATETKVLPPTRPKWVKALLIALGVFVLLLAFAWLALPSLIQWQAPKFIQNKSGHALVMGKPEINPLKLSVRVPALKLSKPDGEELVSFDSLFVDVSGTDLLTGTIALDTVDLQGLHLNAALLPNGELNWTDLINAFKSKEPEPDQPPPKFKLGHLNIDKAAITVEDRRTPNGFKTRLEPLALELHNLSTLANSQSGDFELDANTSFDAQVQLKSQMKLAVPAFTGTLAVKNINLAKLDALLKPLLPTAPPTGTVSTSAQFDVQLADGKPVVHITNTELTTENLAVAAKAGKASENLALAKLAVKGVEFHLPDNTAKVGRVELGGLQGSYANGKPALALDSITVGEVDVKLGEQHAEVGDVALSGLNLALNRDKAGQLNLMDWVNAWVPKTPDKPAENPTKNTTPAKPWTWAVAGVKLDQSAVKFTDDSLPAGFAVGASNIAVATQGLSQNLDKPLPLQASLNLDSGGQMEAKGTVVATAPSASLQLAVNNVALKVAQPFIAQQAKLDMASGTLSTAGKFTFNSKTTEYAGNLAINDLRLNEAGTKKSFLAWKSLSTPAFTASTKAARIGRLNLKGLDTAVLIAKDKSTNINRILVTQPGSPNEPAKPKNEKPTTDKPAGPPAYGVSIDRFNIVDSELDFADESLFIPFGTRIHGLNGSLTGLSNLPGTRGEVALKGDVDDYGLAQANGQLDLFDPTNYLDLKVNFQNVEMTTLTPYSATFANRKIESGKLSLNLEYSIDKQQLNSTNQVLIDKLKLGERVQSPQAVDLPLDLAIAILEDSDGRIDLGIPVKGSLNDPQFSYGAVVWKAFTNVLTKIVTAPFRALGSLFGGGEEALGNVAFDPGVASLSPPQRESLKKLGTALQKRPNLTLTVNGTWANSDKTALQAQQLRRAVALQAGDKLQADEDPGPIALQSPTVQKALEALFTKRLGGGELASLKAGYREANPGKLEQGVAGQALSAVTNLFKDTRKLSPQEVAALKGKDFYAVIAQKLQDSEVVTDAQLAALAKTRQDKALEGLTAAGLTAERVKAGTPKQVEPEDPKTVPLNLDIGTAKKG
ncbi:DUF748 domain-containing protein [Limnobacter humi]|uniref:DUF748 domain-containing protein n=1 Tax=Limnobacter humi TaxID=1778671 RepID=A0ABT1WFL2_9BURK|nr:DUF748 domain-containing protein [Limnobacter humi]MCQ8895688.1 DUF748 domain-containing protein [Limnobacter humi]